MIQLALRTNTKLSKDIRDQVIRDKNTREKDNGQGIRDGDLSPSWIYSNSTRPVNDHIKLRRNKSISKDKAV